MQVIDTIVVPLDGSELAERGLAFATRLASTTGLRVELLTVVEVESEVPIQREYLAGLLAHPGVDASAAEPVVHKAPTEAIAAHVAQRPAAVLCVTSHGHGGLAAGVLGSTTEELLHLVESPIWVVGPSFEPATWHANGAVVALLDGSVVAEDVVPTADEWAQALGLPLQVATVIEQSGETDQYVRAVAEELSSKGPIVNDVTLSGDNPVEAIVAYAAGASVAALAMTTHGRTGFDRIRHGSVAMGVVAKSPAPVLVVRSVAE